MQLIVKFALTATIIVAVSEIAKRYERLGALIAALPFVTIMVMTWLKLEQQDPAKIGAHATYTFWYVLPTLPLFLVIEPLLKQGISYWLVLGLYIVGTTLLFLATAWIGRHFGINLI